MKPQGRGISFEYLKDSCKENNPFCASSAGSVWMGLTRTKDIWSQALGESFRV